jgi:hypothetical protein
MIGGSLGFFLSCLMLAAKRGDAIIAWEHHDEDLQGVGEQAKSHAKGVHTRPFPVGVR